MMLHVPDVLNAQQVREMRASLDAADWIDGRATVGEQGAQVKRNRQLPEQSPVGRELARTILGALASSPLFAFFLGSAPAAIRPAALQPL
jgi:PKHD-type hydroxylase